MNRIPQSIRDERQIQFAVTDEKWQVVHAKSGKSLTRMLYDAKNALIAEYERENGEIVLAGEDIPE